MSKLPRLSGRDCVKARVKGGFYQKRQHGSHLILRQANLSIEEFNALL